MHNFQDVIIPQLLINGVSQLNFDAQLINSDNLTNVVRFSLLTPSWAARDTLYIHCQVQVSLINYNNTSRRRRRRVLNTYTDFGDTQGIVHLIQSVNIDNNIYITTTTSNTIHVSTATTTTTTKKTTSRDNVNESNTNYMNILIYIFVTVIILLLVVICYIQKRNKKKENVHVTKISNEIIINTDHENKIDEMTKYVE